MHCNDMVHTYTSGLNWACSLVIEVVCYWAVPVFFMLSGATLMRYRNRYDTKTFFKKRLIRVLVPFVAWSLIIYVLRFGIEHTSESFGALEFINLFFSNGIEGVYWFFFPLISLYLSMPVLSLLADNKQVLTYITVAGFAFTGVFPPLFDLAGVTWNPSLSLSVAASYIPYATLGFLLATTEISKRNRTIIYILAIAAFALRYFYTLFSSSLLGEVDRTFFQYMQFTAFLPAIAVFVWFKYHDWSRGINLQKHAKSISVVSSCSFGIYLIHRLVIGDVIFALLGVSPTSVLLRTAGPVVVYLVCLGIVYVIKKIPGLKLIVP